MHHNLSKSVFLTTLLFLVFAGCARVPTPKQRLENTLSLVKDPLIVQKNIKTASFDFFTLQKIDTTCKDMKIYIEGDGLSWITKYQISDNPTPLHPLALSLMNVDKGNCKVYVARPCQYNTTKECKEKYWTSHRFSAKVIKDFNEVLNILKQRVGNDSFTLIGYSGGGAIATLLAASRNDVSNIITIAGNIDIEKWVQIHKISPLKGSLNPADYAKKLKAIPQYHLIGAKDKNIPKEVFFSYFNKFQNKQNIKYFIYSSATHNYYWEKNYKNFLEIRFKGSSH